MDNTQSGSPISFFLISKRGIWTFKKKTKDESDFWGFSVFWIFQKSEKHKKHKISFLCFSVFHIFQKSKKPKKTENFDFSVFYIFF